jgi:hypothetical protein
MYGRIKENVEKQNLVKKLLERLNIEGTNLIMRNIDKTNYRI